LIASALSVLTRRMAHGLHIPPADFDVAIRRGVVVAAEREQVRRIVVEAPAPDHAVRGIPFRRHPVVTSTG
jgi:hypothetical protein